MRGEGEGPAKEANNSGETLAQPGELPSPTETRSDAGGQNFAFPTDGAEQEADAVDGSVPEDDADDGYAPEDDADDVSESEEEEAANADPDDDPDDDPDSEYDPDSDNPDSDYDPDERIGFREDLEADGDFLARLAETMHAAFCRHSVSEECAATLWNIVRYI